MVYRINKIHIKNFKLFEDIPQPIVLGNASLTILDGPNGFGKTTIFDVIELVLTGKLKRIKKSDARTRYKEILFQNDSSIESILKIEFIDENDATFTIAKVIKVNSFTEKNSPDNFDIFETYLLENFDDTPSISTLVKEFVGNLITDKFGVDISDILNLVYYIQQEDSKYFLNMNEGDRLNQISMLFNTDQEESEVKKYREVRNLVNKKRSSLLTEATTTEKMIQDLKSQLEPSEDKVTYFQLLPHLKQVVEWDKENLKSMTYETKEKYIQELTSLEQIVIKFDLFKTQLYNNKLSVLMEKRRSLEDFIILKSTSIDLNEIIDLYKNQVNIYGIVEKLSEEKFFMEWKDIDFNGIFHYFAGINPDIFPEDERIKIETKIKELSKIEKNSSNLSESIRDLINTRNSFINKFSVIHSQDNHDSDSVECPLCGEVWSSYDELITNLETKKHIFEGMLDDTSKLIKESLDNLFSSSIKKIYTNSLDYFKPENESIIGTAYYQQIVESKKNEEYVKQLNNWLVENKIDYKEFIEVNNKHLDKFKLEMYSTNLMKLLDSKLIHVEIDLSHQEMKLFASLFLQYFNENNDLIKKCSEDIIQEKKKYINLCYYNNKFSEKEKLTKELDNLQGTITIYNSMYDDLGRIINEYDSKIRMYWKQIMKDIEIVFYIYSATVLQTHQRGSGIFLKESDSKIVRFITHPNKDHDVSNFMSSGQLSAIILALTLSLNKVYGNKGLSLLLIDDPLQTMDDINTSSFIELLRNDFGDKQIVLSTHEENVSSFIRYKFSTYNLNSQSVNLKEKFHI